MRQTLRFKLTAAFLTLTLLAFALIGVVANILLEQQFEKYVIDKLNQKNTEIVDTLKNRYVDWGGQWDLSGLESLSVSALSDGLILKVTDPSGTVLIDAMMHNSGMCSQMLQDMSDNMKEMNEAFPGEYTEKSYQVIVEDSVVANVTIGYYGPYFYTENDINFLNTLNRLLLWMTAIVAMFSIAFGSYMAKRLSVPISRVIKTAEQISKGNYETRVEEAPDTEEIVELTLSINALADTLGKQEALRKRLTADVAHELRTPIANLQGYLEAMIEGIWETDAKRLESCHDETIRLSKIVGDLETLARTDGENLSLKKQRFNLSELLTKVTKSFEKQFRDKDIALAADLREEYLEADEDKIAQVIMNIVSNALKYTLPGGRVEVSTSGTQDEVFLSIKDTGIGISEEDLPYIFERFYRADKSRDRNTGGSGIGLAIVRSLVHAHGGSIAVNSEPGVGTEFIVTLPR